MQHTPLAVKLWLAGFLAIEMATFSSTPIASEYCQVRVGGDLAALKGVMKLVLDAHDAAVHSGREPVLDLPFIEQHTSGFEALSEDLRRTSWDDILRVDDTETITAQPSYL